MQAVLTLIYSPDSKSHVLSSYSTSINPLSFTLLPINGVALINYSNPQLLLILREFRIMPVSLFSMQLHTICYFLFCYKKLFLQLFPWEKHTVLHMAGPQKLSCYTGFFLL